MSTKTLEQRRAGHALACVEKVVNTSLAGRYRSYVESLPAHILMGGLGQAVATELAAARGGEGDRREGSQAETDRKAAHKNLVEHLENWLGQTVYQAGAQESERPYGWLPRAIIDNEQSLYLRAQAEALAWLVWLKKFCQARLPKNTEE